MSPAGKSVSSVLPADREKCVCSTLRAATRHISQLYDDALVPIGLTITGYSLLSKVDVLVNPSMNELAEASLMDRSTLSRNLKPLLDAKFIAVRAGTDRRRKEFSLTASGRKILTAAYPIWRDVQTRFKAQYGAAQADVLAGMLYRTLSVQ